MPADNVTRLCALACATLLAIGAGCGRTAGSGWLQQGVFGNQANLLREERIHRERFREQKDHKALQWLLGNRIKPGMSPTEVSHVLGEDGERIYDDSWLTSDGGYYREHDVAYRWGPDDSGKSVYLVFRDDRLVNFDPAEFPMP